MNTCIRGVDVWVPGNDRSTLEFSAGLASVVALPVLRNGRITAVVAWYF